MTRARIRPRHVALWTGIGVFAADQLSKFVVVHAMGLRTQGTIEVLPPWLTFRMAWNRGINFGLFSGDDDTTRWILVALALAISAWVVWFIRRDAAGTWARVSAGMLVGGALGNVVDRLAYGAVADFLNMSCCGFENPYAFNVADIAIFAGAFGLILFAPDGKTPAAAAPPPRVEPKAPRKTRDGGPDPR